MSHQDVHRGALMVAIVCLVWMVLPVSTLFSRHCPTIYNHNETTLNSFESRRTFENAMDRYDAPSLNEAPILGCSLSSLKPGILWNSSGDLYFDWDSKQNERKLQQKVNKKIALNSVPESYGTLVKSSRLIKDKLEICEQKESDYGNCSIEEGRYAFLTRRPRSNWFHGHSRKDAVFNMSFWHRGVDICAIPFTVSP